MNRINRVLILIYEPIYKYIIRIIQNFQLNNLIELITLSYNLKYKHLNIICLGI